MGALAETVRQVGQQTRQQDNGLLADYVDGAAAQLTQLATTLREQDIDQLGETVSGVARRQPALFLAAAVALGFVGVRFLKSSAPSARQQTAAGASFAGRAPTGTTFPGGDALGSAAWTSNPGAGDALGAFGAGAGRTRSDFRDLGLDAEPGAARPLRVDAGFGAEDR